jgi:hypothetical protein
VRGLASVEAGERRELEEGLDDRARPVEVEARAVAGGEASLGCWETAVMLAPSGGLTSRLQKFLW